VKAHLYIPTGTRVIQEKGRGGNFTTTPRCPRVNMKQQKAVQYCSVVSVECEHICNRLTAENDLSAAAGPLL